MSRGVYAYVCSLCNHLASQHGLADRESWEFECRQCGCRMTQNTPCHELDRRQYERFMAAHAG